MMLSELCSWFVAVAAIVFIAALMIRRISVGQAITTAGLTMIVLVVLTAVFDNLMISVGLFDYGHAQLAGLYIGKAPIEDFTYPVVATLFVTGIYWLCGGAKPENNARATSEGAS